MKALVVCLFVFAVACGGDSTGPKAASVTGVFGDNDSVLTGGTLRIGFTVLSGDGFPLKGAKITWTVAPISAATISPTTQTSDSIGNVSTIVLAGSSIGAFTVTATVGGLAPIDFHLKALDPCHYAVPYALGDTVSAALSQTDCRIFAGSVFYFYDFYQLTLPAGQQSIRINELSTRIDPYVEVYRSTGELLGWDDDIQPGVIQTSQFDVILGSGGPYVIGATSYDPDTTGAYTLIAKPRPTTVAGCQDTWMTPGATITDTIRATDCADSLKNYSDIIFMYMQASEVIRVAERSSVVNPLLKLYNANFAAQRFDSVAANDDSASGNPNAYIAYTVPANGWYLLQIGTATPADTGEYTLAFSANTGPSAPNSRGAARVLRVLPSGTFRGWKTHS
ncbi:MAG: hypothetical protein AUJ01_02945 [Acidobacteria bacterium 13_1_40CM_3_65_5]|nr:MAG: hypothetical protein AUJ01_02945 [Acidobacteria bacterium 13_1_40CM_3_65_5]